MNEQCKHSIFMRDCEVVSVTGVTDVDSFDEKQVRLFTECGELSVYGEDLHVNEMSVDGGSVSVEGKIEAVVYGDRSAKKKLSFLGKLLK